MKQPLIITIDGPAGTGKSTVAKLLASRLRLPILDTGAMYRAVANQCLQQNIPFEDTEQMVAEVFKIRFEIDDEKLLINGKVPGEELRTERVSEAASVIATVGKVRKVLVDQQRKLAGEYSLVSEGRDQGTVVFPDAKCKFFLTASVEVRANRRWSELRKKNATISLNSIQKEIEIRDQRDSNREAAPLKPAADAIIIDSSEKELKDVVNLLAEHVKKCKVK